jgi:hypothetical protein
MASTYEKIATTTLGSAAADITFSSISSAYTDLVLIYDVTQSATSGITGLINSDTGSNYSYTQVYGTGSSALSNTGTSQTQLSVGYSDSTTVRSIGILNFMNYSNTTTHKTVLVRNSSNFLTSAQVNLWRNTAAINAITLKLTVGVNFSTGSNFTLYGIKAA